jgi:hypothetical protein
MINTRSNKSICNLLQSVFFSLLTDDFFLKKKVRVIYLPLISSLNRLNFNHMKQMYAYRFEIDFSSFMIVRNLNQKCE